MKPVTRKQEFLAALAERRVPNITPLTAEEILLYEQAKREAASKNPKWEDIADKPFGEEHTSLSTVATISGNFTSSSVVSVTPAYELVAGVEYGIRANLTDVENGFDETAVAVKYGLNAVDLTFPRSGFFFRYYKNSKEMEVSNKQGPGQRTLYFKAPITETTPIDAKWLPKIAAVPDASGDTPTAAEFNALLAALRDAGYMAADTAL